MDHRGDVVKAHAELKRSKYDANKDGKPDVWVADTDGDGKADLFQFDTDGDGKVDITMVDLNEDGTPDAIVDGDGGFPPAAFVLQELGSNQCWRVDSHLRSELPLSPARTSIRAYGRLPRERNR